MNFQEGEQEKVPINNKVLNIQTAKLLPVYSVEREEESASSHKLGSLPLKNFKSSKYIKPSDRSITETKSYITEFADISDTFGYGYQMSTGLICFVFNDGSEMYFENSLKKTVTYTTEKRAVNKFVYEKISEESEIKKKLFILEAYSKSIKKFKHPQAQGTQSLKLTTVSQYYRTNSAAVFLLSNQTIEVIFNDRVIFVLTKHSIHVQNKSSDKFEQYDSLLDTPELQVRKKYALAMADKLFHWDTLELDRIKARVDQGKST